MGQELFKGFNKAILLLASLCVISACSPKLNWRIVQSPEQGYLAQFPGKPDKLERLVSYQDQEMNQTLEAVKIDDDIYSISSIRVANNQASLDQKILDQLQANLLDRAKASGGQVLIEGSTYQASNSQRFPVKDYFITFGLNGKVQQSMRVRWIVRPIEGGGSWIYQVSVLHTNSQTSDTKAFLSKEDYSNFFSEFRPE